MVGGVSSFGNNVVNLALLQARLASIDLSEASKQAMPAIAGVILVLFAAPAIFVIACVGLALWIFTATDIPAYQAFLLVAGGLLLVLGIIAWICALVIRKSLTTFRRSSDELQRNLSWVRTVILQSGR